MLPISTMVLHQVIILLGILTGAEPGRRRQLRGEGRQQRRGEGLHPGPQLWRGGFLVAIVAIIYFLQVVNIFPLLRAARARTTCRRVSTSSRCCCSRTPPRSCSRPTSTPTRNPRQVICLTFCLQFRQKIDADRFTTSPKILAQSLQCENNL